MTTTRKTGVRQMFIGGGLAGVGGALGVASQGAIQQAELHPVVTGLLAVGIVNVFLGLFQRTYRDRSESDVL